MHDPLSEMIQLLRPQAAFSKGISGAGPWAVRYSDFGHPGFCVVLEGSCLLTVGKHESIVMEAGDFVLLPTTPGFTMSGFEPVTPNLIEPRLAEAPTGEVRHGRQGGDPDVRLLGGYFQFDSPDAALLVSLLPPLIHVRGSGRLAMIVKLVCEETLGERPGRYLMLSRALELLLVEALRTVSGTETNPGLLRGLDDARLASAIRKIHERPAHPWTTDELASAAALSRSAFFDRFKHIVGVPPMEYLTGWRMALAKDLLRRGGEGIDDIAERVGYGSASAFSTAFSRHVGQPPKRYARDHHI